MALQEMQDALINLYVNPEYRKLAYHDIVQRHDLNEKEGSIVAGVLADEAALRRYRNSLIEKKWGFLWRQSRANIAADLAPYEDEVHHRFVATWPFLDGPLGRELQAFVDLISDVASAQGDPAVDKALALGRLRLGVLFQASAVDQGQLSYSEAIPADPAGQALRIAPWTEVEHIRVGAEDSYFVGTPSRTSFVADVFQISRPIYDVLSRARTFDSFENLVEGLATAAAVSPDDADAVIRKMIGRGVFEFQP